MSRATPIRWMRALVALFLLMNLILGTLTAMRGSANALINFGVAVFLVGVMCFQTFTIRSITAREREAARPRPDYAKIARMEREIWGEAFDHAGSPTDPAWWTPQQLERGTS